MFDAESFFGVDSGIGDNDGSDSGEICIGIGAGSVVAGVGCVVDGAVVLLSTQQSEFAGQAPPTYPP